MRQRIFSQGAILVCCGILGASIGRGESLTYKIKWPSGLEIGEATLSSTQAQIKDSKGNWTFDMAIDASIPAFAVLDHYHSTATPQSCTIQLDKQYKHGSRKAEERLTFDQDNHTVKRETLPSGGHSEVSVSTCARGPMAFLEYARHELVEGRLPPEQDVVFGALYRVRLVYKDEEKIPINNTAVDVDHLTAEIKGPSTNLTIDLYFARDAARTPVLARIPLDLGTFTVERVP